MDSVKLQESAIEVLRHNDRGGWTVPAGDLYPHQWLWDSCFISMGLRHIDLDRAKIELKNLQRGQWANGMLPHIIFSGEHHKGIDLDEILWESALNPYAPKSVATSGITQPPLLAEAVWRIGQKLRLPERRTWFKQMLPTIIAYHQWLYRDRDPDNEGLIVLLHPYECGLDNSPPWIDELYQTGIPWWVRFGAKLHLLAIADIIRRDVRHSALKERMTNIEALSFWVALRRIRRFGYSSKKTLQKPFFAVQDLTFNSILVRSNTRLKDISKTAGGKLPQKLVEDMHLSEQALESLWDESDQRYYSRSFIRKELIREPSIAGFMPLYAGTIKPERADRLLELLNKRGEYKSTWPVPSVPTTSKYFDPVRYWQGPSWINTNWLIIQGLKQLGHDKQAEHLTAKTLEMASKSGFAEYYNPLNGEPHGARNFSWSAALVIDLLKS